MIAGTFTAADFSSLLTSESNLSLTNPSPTERKAAHVTARLVYFFDVLLM
jgi:hypothetical protein